MLSCDIYRSEKDTGEGGDMTASEGFKEWWEKNKNWCRAEDKAAYSCAYAGGVNDTMKRSMNDILEDYIQLSKEV